MKSIRLRLWTSMMIVVLIVIMLLWFFQIAFLEKFYTDIKIKQVRKRGYEVINNIESLKNVEIENTIDKLSYNNNLNIQLINIKDDYVAYESTGGSSVNNKSHGHGRKGYISDLEFEQIMNKEEIVESKNYSKFGNQIVTIGFPLVFKKDSIGFKKGDIGVMFMNMSLTSIKNTTDILKKQLLYITIILLIVSTSISFFLARMFTKPILEIQRVTKKIAKGDFSEKIDVRRKDEIGGLADSINDMGVELSKIEELRKDLIANVSHELRTPLSLIQGYAEMIRDVSGDKKEKREEQLDIVIDESKRLSMVVDDILSLSQIQSGYIEMNESENSINDLIYNIVKKYDVLSRKKGVSIDTRLDEDVKLMIDKTKIEQVFYNLINNAFNHTSRGDKIVVSTSLNNESIKIVVKDNGLGIQEKELENIWDRYYKNEKISKRDNLGTGLGLSIVKNILESHHSDYGVDSILGVETTFWFKLKRK